MTDAIYIFVVVLAGALSLWGMFHKPAHRNKKKYEGVKDLLAWHKNVSTRWE